MFSEKYYPDKLFLSTNLRLNPLFNFIYSNNLLFPIDPHEEYNSVEDIFKRI